MPWLKILRVLGCMCGMCIGKERQERDCSAAHRSSQDLSRMLSLALCCVPAVALGLYALIVVDREVQPVVGDLYRVLFGKYGSARSVLL